jgi:hypothetical protein
MRQDMEALIRDSNEERDTADLAGRVGLTQAWNERRRIKSALPTGFKTNTNVKLIQAFSRAAMDSSCKAKSRVPEAALLFTIMASMDANATPTDARETWKALVKYGDVFLKCWLPQIGAEPESVTPKDDPAPEPLAPPASLPPAHSEGTTPKIVAALAVAGADGLSSGQLHAKTGAYLTDIDLAVKQGLIRQVGEKYLTA